MAKTRKDTGEDAEDKARKKARETVAKHLRFNVACKNAVIKRQKVEYFVASKAVDCLMESKWSKQMPPEEDDYTPYFSVRADAVVFCKSLVKDKLIVRARKVEVGAKSGSLASEEPASGREKREKEGAKRRGKATDSPRAEKKKKKFRLEVHPQQVFIDSAEEVYLWKYDPTSRSSYIIGFAVVLGAIAVTMQPLWPKSTRVGVWYLSMVLFAVIGVLIAIIVLRWFIYGLVLIFSVGKVTFWIFPNMDNDKCGFVESFKPFYSVEVAKDKKKKKKSKEAHMDHADTEGDKPGREGEGQAGEEEGEEEALQEKEEGPSGQSTETCS